MNGVLSRQSETRQIHDSPQAAANAILRDHEGELVFAFGTDNAIGVICDLDQGITAETLAGVFEKERVEAWSGATVGAGEPWDVVWLRMATFEPGACRLTTTREAIDAGRVPADLLTWTHALVVGGSLAYFTTRLIEDTDERCWELGAVGYGPAATGLVERICEHIHDWDPDRTATLRITVWRTEPDLTTGSYPIIRKNNTFLVA